MAASSASSAAEPDAWRLAGKSKYVPSSAVKVAMPSAAPLTDLDMSRVTMTPIKPNKGGQGSSSWYNVPGGKDSRRYELGSKLPVKGTPRPGRLLKEKEGETVYPVHEKVNLELEVTPEIAAILDAFDQLTKRTALEHKGAWFGSDKAAAITSVSDFALSYRPLLQRGKDVVDKQTGKATGEKWADTVKFGLYGYADAIVPGSVKVAKGANGKEYVESVEYKDIPYYGLANPLKEGTTKLYLYESTGADGIDNITPWVRTASGGKRWVGPQDITRGCLVTAQVDPSHAWKASSEFGPMMDGIKVVIYPKPAPVDVPIAGARVRGDDDENEHVNDEAPAARDAEDAAAADAAEAGRSVGRKRSAEAAGFAASSSAPPKEARADDADDQDEDESQIAHL